MDANSVIGSGSGSKKCMDIPGYQPEPNYPHLITNIDRWSAVRPFACGQDKICLSKPVIWKEVLFYIGMALFFAGALAVMILMIIIYSYSENKTV